MLSCASEQRVYINIGSTSNVANLHFEMHVGGQLIQGPLYVNVVCIKRRVSFEVLNLASPRIRLWDL